jgi:hypothetical protein
MAENSKNTPDYEYSKVDCSITINFGDKNAVPGDLPLADRFESATFAPNADAGTMAGSGRTPRAHRATRYGPELTITTDADMSDEIQRRQGKRAIKSVTIVRQRPNDSPITTIYEKWNAQYGDMEMGDDPIAVEVTGLLLGWKPDRQKKISITT